MDTHLEYVWRYLSANGTDQADGMGRSFRSRSSHTRRVLMWLERLLTQGGVDNTETLRLAAAFHDVGYAHGKDAHAAHGAEVLRAYGLSNGLDTEMVERAAFIVSEHSDKEKWLQTPSAPMDLVLLMEADMLDEEGAMGIVFDCLTVGVSDAAGYEEVYKRMQVYEPKRLAKNPMVTPLARRYWAQKQELIRGFIEAYAFDLGVE